MLPIALIVFSQFLYLNRAKGEICQDGRDNILWIQDIRPDSSVQFSEIKLLTYDASRKPFCASNEQGKKVGAIHLPGFIQIASGLANIAKHVDKNAPLLLDLTIEHNSFFIGKVCEEGISQSSFVPDDVCSYDICQILAPVCDALRHVGKISLAENHPELIPLYPSAFSYVEGEWKAQASLSQNGLILASVRASTTSTPDESDLWCTVKLGDEEDENIFYEHIDPKSTHTAQKHKPTDEL
ncbi:DAF-16/FOXO Controlled, germline Tumor affecting [Ditylenchus destructor]|nr:DAF-16/FOXO Controlled, germline Tumor affecting [Ditylenchus destructor]